MLSYLPKSISKIINKFNKSSIWFKTLSIILLCLILSLIFKKEVKEGFRQEKKFVVKNNEQLYDDFYCSIYDELVYDDHKNDFEVKTIDRIAKINKNSNVLDIGSGRGHHVNHYTRSGIKIQGLDKSGAMTKCAKKKYPNCTFKNGDVLQSMNYNRNQFSHIMCLYFTIYYVKDKGTFFKNVYDWLKPGGFLIVHLVNRDKFDPIINSADPLIGVSAQKHAPKRITNSNVKFKDFLYKANFNYTKGENIANFTETFTDDKTKHVRQNEHKLHMDTQKNILSKAKNVGFILEGQVNMVPVQYEYQYLYFLKKPQ